MVDCYCTSTNRTINTNGQVECTHTQVEVIGNILISHNEMHYTNGISMN